MHVIETALQGVRIIEPRVFPDRRGHFYESFNQLAYAAHGIVEHWVQDNHSHSVRGVVRGLHYQAAPGQAKLVRVVVGEVYDVAVDVRWGSPTFGQHVGVVLSAENKRQLYIPVGFAHGFCVLGEAADLVYKVAGLYSPKDERGVRWDDPALGIEWPVEQPILSDKDLGLPLLRDIPQDYIWQS